MTSYFDEHDCQPLPDAAASADQWGNNDLLEFARFLILTGNWREDAFADIFNDRPPPPTSSRFIENLEKHSIERNEERSCPICLKNFVIGDEFSELPCKHQFHLECLLPWLKKTSSCPMCRTELPTDDPDWEEMKRQKKRDKEREADLEALHDSMFG